MSGAAIPRLAGMPLAEVLPGIRPLPALEVAGIASDSRAVRPGDLFLAVPGGRSHGMDYAAAAAAGGAVAIAADPAGLADESAPVGVPVVRVPGLKAMLGSVADRFFGAPSSALEVIGVTGTNGKTTVAWLLAHSAGRLGQTAAYLGTLGAGIAGSSLSGGELTTPGTVEIHAGLARFRDQAATLAALEVSSHALDQDRVAGVRFAAVLFTNLSRDHLDYHGSMEAYFAAKAKLFRDCGAARRVVCTDTRHGAALAATTGPDTVTVTTSPRRGRHHGPGLAVRSIVATPLGSDFRFASTWGDGLVRLPIPGAFNVANAAVVVATLLARGEPLDRVVAAMAGVSAPPGRLERVAAPGPGPSVYVDFAHTPAALDAVLAALRPHVEGRLHVVFGAGGARDRGKRPLMAAAAERRADRVVLTSDNPRHERPSRIIEDLVGGLRRPREAIVVENRAAAIECAIRAAGRADTVLVAGKGHERYQEIGDERQPFADRAIAATALAHWPGDRP